MRALKAWLLHQLQGKLPEVLKRGDRASMRGGGTMRGSCSPKHAAHDQPPDPPPQLNAPVR
eukprot:1160668-Pelagomonas_calceolata.AAC.3